MIKIGIVGATGYTGVELLRLLAAHPTAEVKVVTSRSEAGIPLSHYFPSLSGSYNNLSFLSPDQVDWQSCDIVFFATPHGVAMKEAANILSCGTKIVDLSADFRLKNTQLFEHYYGMPHTALDLLSEAVYGLSEVNADAIRQARLVANPGCYPTVVQLALWPLLSRGMIDAKQIIADCKSGVSGAGRKADINLLHAEVSDNFKAYGIKGHRHLPEIEQGLQTIDKNVQVVFIPHLVPMIRGMLATIYTPLKSEYTLQDVQAQLETHYADSPFVSILPSQSMPETRHIRGTNKLLISASLHHNQLTLIALQDNLVKGAAGQAIQNMNLMFGLPEETGLSAIALVP